MIKISINHRLIRMALIGIVVVAFGGSCEKEAVIIDQAEAPGAVAADTMAAGPPALSYLALGDSYTIGASVPEKDRFPEQLAAELRLDSFPVEPVQIIARTGWTTDELLTGILEADLSDTAYQLVTLLIGVNNQYRGRSLDNYREEFTTLLLRAVALAGGRPGRVIVLSIPDYGVTPFVSSEEDAQRIGREIDAFNDAAGQICRANAVRFLDITPISRQAATDRSLIASDGLHPSGEMYRKWVALLLPAVREVLE